MLYRLPSGLMAIFPAETGRTGCGRANAAVGCGGLIAGADTVAGGLIAVLGGVGAGGGATTCGARATGLGAATARGGAIFGGTSVALGARGAASGVAGVVGASGGWGGAITRFGIVGGADLCGIAAGAPSLGGVAVGVRSVSRAGAGGDTVLVGALRTVPLGLARMPVEGRVGMSRAFAGSAVRGKFNFDCGIVRGGGASKPRPPDGADGVVVAITGRRGSGVGFL